MIYIIDDDKSVTRAFGILIRSAGLDYRLFESAEEFMEVFRPSGSGNDLIVLDLNLPRINGCELLKMFSQRNIQIPIIVVTAHDDPKWRDQCRTYGIKAYLKKPVDSEALLDTIRYYIYA